MRDTIKEMRRRVAGGQAIKRHARIEVVNVVVADVSREPMQHARQVTEGGAVEPCTIEIPFALVRPIRILELVMDVEEPGG